MPKAKILFIEDDPDQIRIYDFKFKLEGYDFITALNMVESIRMVEVQRPDLILLDILLYDENGIDILKVLKKSQKTKNIPVIVFTNFDKEETVKESLSLGAVEYIIKSKTTPGEIVKKVASILNKSRTKNWCEDK